MRKKVIIIVQIILVIFVLRYLHTQHVFDDYADNLMQWFESFIEVPERSKIFKLRDGFMRNNMSLQPHQVDYVHEVTDNAEAITRFYTLYCIQKDKNPYIYGANLEKFCSDIRNSELLIN